MSTHLHLAGRRGHDKWCVEGSQDCPTPGALFEMAYNTNCPASSLLRLLGYR